MKEQVPTKKKYYKQDNSTRKDIRFGEMLEKINKARGATPLGTWVKQACEMRLKYNP